MGKIFRFIFGTLFLGILAGVAWIGLMLLQAAAPMSTSASQLVVITPGQGVADMGATLADLGLVKGVPQFVLATILRGQITALKAGEYEFVPHLSTFQVIDQIAAGQVYARKLTIPEGVTTAFVVNTIKSIDALVGDVVTAPSEGTLLPETYLYSRGDSRTKLIARMTSAMAKAQNDLWAARPADFPLKTPLEWVTLASIVEKETGLAGERPRVAAVFLNRLKLGMKLQSDPTVIYAITRGAADLGRSLTTRDLTETDSPYNTYRVAGLPPGPIANPGLASLRAVLNPAVTNDLYFVADGTGGHAFAATLAEHNANVARWRTLSATANRGAKNTNTE